jgi:hypothetical protein
MRNFRRRSSFPSGLSERIAKPSDAPSAVGATPLPMKPSRWPCGGGEVPVQDIAPLRGCRAHPSSRRILLGTRAGG